jgi:hypothetical protein
MKVLCTVSLVIVLTLLLASCTKIPEGPDISWERVLGGDSADIGASVQQTSDGGFIVGGHTKSYGAGSYDIYVIKLDNQGNVLWEKAYGGDSTDFCLKVMQNPTGGYSAVGYTYHATSPDECFVYMIELDAQGDTVHTNRCYVGWRPWDVAFLEDGSIVVVGVSSTGVASAKIGSDGSMLWSHSYYDASYNKWAGAIDGTHDGGFIIAGAIFPAEENIDIWLMKTDAHGDSIWAKWYRGSGIETCWNVQQTSDDGYIIAGYRANAVDGPYDFYIVKTDGAGGTLWTQTHGNSDDDCCQAIIETSDGGYVAAGYTFSASENNDCYLVKISHDGDIAWISEYGSSDDDAAFDAIECSDGGYVLVGVTASYSGLTTDQDVYVVKTNRD